MMNKFLEVFLAIIFVCPFGIGALIIIATEKHEHPSNQNQFYKDVIAARISYTVPGGFSGRTTTINAWDFSEGDNGCCTVLEPNRCSMCGKIWNIDTVIVCGSYVITKN